MRLEPDLNLLERIGILNQFDRFKKPGGYQMEVEGNDLIELSPFLIEWGDREAIQELFFYQLNFVPINSPPPFTILKTIQENKAYFESREKILKMDFSQLQRINLNFGKGENADLPPDLVKYFGEWIRKELESEKPAETIPAEKLQELKEIEKTLHDSKLKIQKAIPQVEAILKGKSPEAIFDRKQVILCTYGLFYQRGHRLNFKGGETPENVDPIEKDSFDHVRVYDILRRE